MPRDSSRSAGSTPGVDDDPDDPVIVTGAAARPAAIRSPLPRKRRTGWSVDEDRRRVTALFWSNINPYGTFRLELDKQFDLGLTVSVLRPRSAGAAAAAAR